MSSMQIISVPRRPVAAFEPVIGAERYHTLLTAAARFRERLAGRTIWNVNSTAAGGGVAEMLQGLVGYVRDLDVPINWIVLDGDARFFGITKRLHNLVHGDAGGEGPLTADDAEHYARVLSLNAAELVERIRPGDLVLLHDPQTAGLAAALVDAGARVVWRCHIGVNWTNDATRAGWEFLRPHLAAAHAYVFTRRQYVPSWVPDRSAWIVPPSIDPFSAKNQQLDDGTVHAILCTIGVLDGAAPAPGRFVRRDGTTGEVTRAAVVAGDGRPDRNDPVVVQVSRWDRLKDMIGVLRGFANYVAPTGPGYLMLVGPQVNGIVDDPEGAVVYADCLAFWRELPPAVRSRVLLVTLPLDDVDENAAMVNALQRHAAVITQKSLAEGFGLTVAEGMWKARPVVGSAVGGIVDQIVDGTGVLLADPGDLAAFGSAARRLLDEPDKAARMGAAAQAYVRDNYIGDLHLLRYARLFHSLLPPDGSR